MMRNEGWALQRRLNRPKIVSTPPSPFRLPPSPSPAHTSIFQHRRLDYDTILDLIPPGASVLDLGCGTGELLARLRDRGHRQIMGIEWDEQAIVACVRRGLDVVQSDLNKGLAAFADGQFDIVVLSQTLQAVLDVPARAARHAAGRPARDRQFPQRRLSQAASRAWPSKAARRAFTPNTVSNGTTRPMSARSRSPISRSFAASKALRSANKSPWTPKPTPRSTTIPTSTPTWR